MFVTIGNMDYQLSSPVLFASFMLFAVMILKIFKKSGNNHPTSNLPPGPWRLPLIGNMHQLVGSLPHRRLRDLALKYGPLMHLQLGEVSHIVVSSTETVKEILKHHDISFAQRPQVLAMRIFAYDFSDIAFGPYGDYWRQLRKICALNLLSAKRVQSYRSIREEEVSKLVKSISSSPPGSPINVSKLMFSLTADIISRAAIGGRCKDREAFVHIVQKITELAGGFSLADLFPSIKLLEVVSGMRSEIERVHGEADMIIENIMNEHRAVKAMGKTDEGQADDLLDVLLNIQQQGDLELPLTDDNIKAVVVDMFVAGIETSSATVVWAMSEMMRNPRVLEKAQAEVRKVFGKGGNVNETRLDELEYLKLVIKEALRLHPPAPLLLPRECRESCKISGFNIPEGTKVIVNAWAIGRDPNYWTEAESFYPERFLDGSIDYKGNHLEFIPFGAGRRICPGLSFGVANTELPLAQLLYHFDWKLPDGIKSEELDMAEHFGGIVGRKNDLYLFPVPYDPLLNE